MERCNFIHTLSPHKERRFKLWFITSGTLFLAVCMVLALLTASYCITMMRTQRHINRLERQLKNNPNYTQASIAEQELGALTQELATIEAAKEQGAAPASLFTTIAHAAGQTIHCTAINFSNKMLSIEGVAHTTENILDFMKKLAAAKTITDVSLHHMNTGMQEGNECMRFTLHCGVR